MDDFNGQIRSLKVYGEYFWDFFNKQTQKVQSRILWTIRLIRDIQFVPKTYLKYLENTDGLYEIRVSSGSNIFRIFWYRYIGLYRCRQVFIEKFYHRAVQT